uniref:RING-type domain-containing protein n=1 Tax=Kalanchoe fedtschenkoi TaxID=63787 RepID=A0A7N0VJE2_KALFE
MWNFASSAIASLGLKRNCSQNSLACVEDSDDDEASSESSKEEGLECPICWESFNIVENVPYVLWCGHTVCKNCVLGLQCASMKVSSQKIRIPSFISCPWCHLLSLRFVHNGNLKFPRKNYFLLWMVEGLNGDRVWSCPAPCETSSHPRPGWLCNPEVRRAPRPRPGISDSNARRRHTGFNKPWDVLVKLFLLLLFILIVLFVIPASAAVLAMYLIITVIFAAPSLLILYFAYPTIDWLIREISS